MKVIPNDYTELRKVAAAEGINARKKKEIQKELEKRGWVQQVIKYTTEAFQKAFTRFKDWFRGGLWIHIYLDDQDNIKIRITDTKTGPAITTRDLNETEATKLMKELTTKEAKELTRKKIIKKRTRVTQRVTAAKKANT